MNLLLEFKKVVEQGRLLRLTIATVFTFEVILGGCSENASDLGFVLWPLPCCFFSRRCWCRWLNWFHLRRSWRVGTVEESCIWWFFFSPSRPQPHAWCWLEAWWWDLLDSELMRPEGMGMDGMPCLLRSRTLTLEICASHFQPFSPSASHPLRKRLSSLGVGKDAVMW